jgi:hypothetical protein
VLESQGDVVNVPDEMSLAAGLQELGKLNAGL